MKRVWQWVVASVIVLALSAPSAAAQSKGKRSATPAKATIPLKDPMIFYLARGEAHACGPGCSEWIAAEGTIANGTAQRMRTFLKRHGGKRPIYFHSPGGITSESLAMGRAMRERGMIARVGRTVPDGCADDAKECTAPKRSGREVAARLTSTMAQCNSACVYTIVGARLREIPPEAHLGVHASKTVIVGNLPKGTKIPASMRARFKAENHQLIRRYLVEMGIAPALLDAAEKIPHESIRALSRAEMVLFNIDPRSVVESSWIYDERISDTGGIVFKSIDISEAGGSEYRKTMLRVSCLGSDKFLVGYARELGPKESPSAPLKLVAAAEQFTLAPQAEPVSSSDLKKQYDVRRIPVPRQAFESVAAEDRIELAPDAGEGKAAVTRLSTLGLASALSSLTRRCNQGASLGGTALVPRQTP